MMHYDVTFFNVHSSGMIFVVFQIQYGEVIENFIIIILSSCDFHVHVISVMTVGVTQSLN